MRYDWKKISEKNAAHIAGAIAELRQELRAYLRRVAHLGDAAEVLLLDAADGDRPRLYEVFEGHVVDPLGGEDDVGARREDLLDALLREGRG